MSLPPSLLPSPPSFLPSPPSFLPSPPSPPSLPPSLPPSQDDQDEDPVLRALSDHWVYRQKCQNWGRKTHHRSHSDGSEGGNLADTSIPPSPSNPLVISELRGSLTDLSREVKTYSFCPPDDSLPPIIIDPPGTTEYASTSTPSPNKQFFPPSSRMDDDDTEGQTDIEEGRGPRCGRSMGSEADSDIFDFNFDPLEEESFVSGLCTAFDTTMQKFRSTDQRSHSLPNVFSLGLDMGHEIIDTSYISTTTDENTSTSVSVASVLGDSTTALDEPPIARVGTPDALSRMMVNGDSHGAQKHSYVRTSSATTLPPGFKIGAENSPRVASGSPKWWSGPGSDATGGYESGGSDIGEAEREGRRHHSPLVDNGWMSRSYAHPPRKRRSPDPGSPVKDREPTVRRRKKRPNRGLG